MRMLILSMLIVTTSAAKVFANDAEVMLEFRPIAEIGANATTSKGPADEPAVEVLGGDKASTTLIMIAESPEISSHQYVVRGRIKYEDIVGTGYLELWNDFGDKGAHFSRSLGDSGGLQKLTGTSDWRAFELPFYAEPGMKPKKLSLNVVLPGAGKVTISQPLIVAPISTADAQINSPKANPGGQKVEAKGPQGEAAIQVTGNDQPTTTELKIWDKPETTSHQYAVRGQVKYEEVAGVGYLELWNDFGERGMYFSRSLGDWGGLKKIQGTSDWRAFELPFTAEPGMKPQRLILNVVLPSTGKVIISESLVVAPLNQGEAQAGKQPAGGQGATKNEVKGPNDETAIEVVGTKKASTTQLKVWDKPEIASHQYVVRGKVKYEGVKGDGYLELWNDFGEKGTYFSRTLGDWGGMRKLNGTSDWRSFELPFNAEPGMKPTRLTLNVVLPGAGKVTVSSSLEISTLSTAGQWWGVQQTGWLGGLIGVAGGLFGTAFGLAAAWGKSRAMSVKLCKTGLVTCALLLVTGIIALCLGQPYHVYYPLLLPGLIGVFVFSFNLPNMSRLLRDDEIRRMQAVDAV